MIVWDVARASAGETLAGHAGQVSGLAFSDDGATCTRAAWTARSWSGTSSGEPPARSPVRRSRTSDDSPRFSLRHDGRELAIGHDDGTVALIDARTLRPRSSFRATPKGPVTGMGYVPRSNLLVVGGENGFLALFDPATGRELTRLQGQSGDVVTPGFSADGRLMAALSGLDTVRVYALPSGRPVEPRDPLRDATSPTSRSARTGARSRSRGHAAGSRRDPRRAHAAAAARPCPTPSRCGTSCASRPTGAS